jgi:hypothetical protein
MTRDEQDDVCRAIAVSCMWGQGGIASVILEELDRKSPLPEMSWTDAYKTVKSAATRSHMGVITEQAELDRYLSRGYWLANHDAEGCALFNPPPMNGLAKYVSKELAQQALDARAKLDAHYRSLSAANFDWVAAGAFGQG